MSPIRQELINAAFDKAYALIDYNTHDDMHKRYEFKTQTILADESLTEDEKLEAMCILNEGYDLYKIIYNEGIKRICENCKEECFATLHCEHCIRNYLIGNFSNWTSGNN